METESILEMEPVFHSMAMKRHNRQSRMEQLYRSGQCPAGVICSVEEADAAIVADMEAAAQLAEELQEEENQEPAGGGSSSTTPPIFNLE
eukprot:scaffold1362_cov125-Cylindrotheca_fusiformis.AAC.12